MVGSMRRGDTVIFDLEFGYRDLVRPADGADDRLGAIVGASWACSRDDGLPDQPQYHVLFDVYEGHVPFLAEDLELVEVAK